MQIGEVIHRKQQSDYQINQTSKTSDYQINQTKTNYHAAQEVIKAIPFPVNPNFYKLLAWHLQRVGLGRFQDCVEAARRARSPERYLMVCLKNENRCEIIPKK